MMKSKLIETVKTKEEMRVLYDEVNVLKLSMFRKGSSDFQNILHTVIRKKTADIILSETPNLIIEEYLEGLLSELEKINSVSITLAYEPTQIEIERFYEFVQASVAKKIVLDLLYDPAIVGGMVISYGGRYKDYSFRKIFEEDLESTRTEVLSYLHKQK